MDSSTQQNDQLLPVASENDANNDLSQVGSWAYEQPLQSSVYVVSR